MWDRSAKQADGTFNATVYKDGEIFAQQGGFTSVAETEAWAQGQQRIALFGQPTVSWDDVFAEMDELGL